MLASDNKFTGEWSWRMWRKLHKACSIVKQNALGVRRLPLTYHASYYASLSRQFFAS